MVEIVDNTTVHRQFAVERIGEKSVYDVPGIGTALGDQLSEQGITKASHLLGYFLINDGDETRFKAWLGTTLPGSNDEHRRSCFKGLSDHWTVHFQ